MEFSEVIRVIENMKAAEKSAGKSLAGKIILKVPSPTAPKGETWLLVTPPPSIQPLEWRTPHLDPPAPDADWSTVSQWRIR